ncbi:hypothetical protein Tco_0126136, partial [Tanacetum coccineum]
ALVSSKRPGLDLNKDKSQFVLESLVFGEDDDGVEDEGVESIFVNSWSFSVSEDTRVD